MLERSRVWGSDCWLEVPVMEGKQLNCSPEHRCGLNAEPGQVLLEVNFCSIVLSTISDMIALRAGKAESCDSGMILQGLGRDLKNIYLNLKEHP